MIQAQFIKSPSYAVYLKNKQNIPDNAIVFCESDEYLIAQNHIYKFFKDADIKAIVN